MKDTEYAFAVSAVRVRECSLLGKAQLESLITSENEVGAVRLLEDLGYSGISEDAEGVLAKRMTDVTEYIRDISPREDILSFLFVKNDYHNLKAAMKCHTSGIDPAPYFLPEAEVSHEDILRAVKDRNYSILPEDMRKCAEAAWNAVVTEMNGQLCEMILDRGALEASVKAAERTGDDFCAGLARLRCRNASFIIAYRCAATGKTGDFTSLALPDVEPFLRDKLVSASRSGTDEVMALCRENGIDVGEESGAMAILAAVRAAEGAYVARTSYVSMGAAPIVSYFLRAEAEVSFIREILSCKRCGFTEENIRERVGGAF